MKSTDLPRKITQVTTLDNGNEIILIPTKNHAILYFVNRQDWSGEKITRLKLSWQAFDAIQNFSGSNKQKLSLESFSLAS